MCNSWPGRCAGSTQPGWLTGTQTQRHGDGEAWRQTETWKHRARWMAIDTEHNLWGDTAEGSFPLFAFGAAVFRSEHAVKDNFILTLVCGDSVWCERPKVKIYTLRIYTITTNTVTAIILQNDSQQCFYVYSYLGLGISYTPKAIERGWRVGRLRCRPLICFFLKRFHFLKVYVRLACTINRYEIDLDSPLCGFKF